ncbi:UDP-glucose 4-epimerase [Aestuariispira insulae]|uniref:UDP-glucose 4-epimerase n=1 Tax=Aestuariispira insulae TaxID=1461337 RepID=A0A3D9H9M7_9PROT|nr:UDP-glucose 4-epimerase [Aestuariispira insulae]
MTGADGFIGSHLTEHLVRAGADVTALAAYNSFDANGWLDDLEPDIRDQVRIIRGDVRDAAFTMREIRGQDMVFHLAALIAIPHSYVAAQSYVDVNVTGTLNILEAARTANCERVIHTSTSEVYGTAQFTPITEQHPLQGQSPYAASKIGADMMAEAYARSHGLPVMILRPFNTYGPRQSERAVIPTVIRQALDPACDEIRLGSLDPKRDFNFVGDTAQAFLAMAVTDGLETGSPYNTGTGVAVSIAEIVAEIKSTTGSTKPVVTEDARKRPENSEVGLLLADNGRLRDTTDWQPETDLADGLAKTVSWWQRRLQAGLVRPDRGYAT